MVATGAVTEYSVVNEEVSLFIFTYMQLAILQLVHTITIPAFICDLICESQE